MKTISLFGVLLVLATGLAYGYDSTLITDQTEVGGFATPTIRFMEVGDDLGLLGGAKVGVLINHSLGVSVMGYGTILRPGPEDLEDLESLEIAYGGIAFEYIFMPHSVFHVCVPVSVGGGRVRFVGKYRDPDSGEDSGSFFMVEPELDLEVNLTRNLRLNLGVAYLSINGTDFADFTDEDLSSLTGTVALRVGSF
jgi:hypothetical protein